MKTILIYILVSKLTGMPVFESSFDRFASYTDCTNAIAQLASANPRASSELTCKSMRVIAPNQQ